MPPSASFPPLAAETDVTVELFKVVKMRRERKRAECLGRVLDMSDGVTGSCGNEGRGAVWERLWKCQKTATLQGIVRFCWTSQLGNADG